MEGEEKAPRERGFFDHLEILRRGIVGVLLAFLAAASAAFAFMDRIMPLFTAPATKMGLSLYALAPFEKFTSYLKASALLGAIAAIPLAASLAAAFVAPALSPKARRSLGPGVAILCLFVLAGAALAWIVMVPFAVGFFASFASGDGIKPMWSLGSYVSLASGLVAAMALIFLAPPVLLALMRAGILKASTLAKGRRYAIVAIAIVAGVVTPTVDAISQCIVGASLWGLFELTLLLGRIIAPSEGRRGPSTEVLDGQT
jgi:sec-independent protein translocase protein TatC